MGQLERYGLYVLCVVIVLILGVAIWGGDPAAGATSPDRELEQALAAGAEGAAPNGGAPLAEGGPSLGFFNRVSPPVQAPPSADSELDDVTFGDAGSPDTGTGPRTEKPRPDTDTDTATDTETAPAPALALRTYRVQQHDTMSGIAKKLLGGERHVGKIKKLNPGVDPEKMPIGTELKLPTTAELETPAAPPKVAAVQAGWREYKVQKGDSASLISQKMYDTTRHAKRILEENGIADPTKLQQNTVLRIPPIQ